MAKGDIEVLGNVLFGGYATKIAKVAASATLIYSGEPIKSSTVSVVKSADTEPVTSAPTFVGIAVSDSTNTAAAIGEVEYVPALPGQIFMASAKTAASIDTQAKYDALKGLSAPVLFDLTSSTFTVDTDATGATYGLIIEPSDIKKYPGKVKFSIRSTATVWA